MRLGGFFVIGGLALATAVLIELSYRVYLFGLDGLSYAAVESVRTIGRSGLIRASPYPEIIFELIPNLDTQFKLARLRTNSAGLPDREYALVKPPDTYRIVLLGSSFSMPSGVALEDSWQDVLERSLNARARRGHFEVINFSVGGYDPRQLLATLKYRAADYHPDLILVDVTLSSPRILRPDRAYAEPFTPLPQSHPFFHSFAFERLSEAWRRPFPDLAPR